MFNAFKIGIFIIWEKFPRNFDSSSNPRPLSFVNLRTPAIFFCLFFLKKIPTGHHQNSTKFIEIQMITDWPIVCKAGLKIFAVHVTENIFFPQKLFIIIEFTTVPIEEKRRKLTSCCNSKCFHLNFLFESVLGKKLVEAEIRERVLRDAHQRWGVPYGFDAPSSETKCK